MEPVSILAANLVFAVGSVLQAATGLGAGLVVVPLLALISLDFVPGPVILAALALAFLMAWRGRSQIHYPGMPILLIGLFIGMLMGAGLLARLPLERLGLMFGSFILLAVLVSVSGIRLKLGSRPTLIAGVASGFMGTTAAIGAPILALLYQHQPGPVLRATLGLLYLLSSMVMLALLHLAGRFGTQELFDGLMLVPGVLIGYCIAGYLAKYIDRGYSRIAVLAISTLSALVLIARSF